MCNTLIVPGQEYRIAFEVIQLSRTLNRWDIVLGLVNTNFPMEFTVPGTQPNTYGIGITSKTFMEGSHDPELEHVERQVFEQASSGTTYGMRLNWKCKTKPIMTLYQNGEQRDESVLQHLTFDTYRFCVAILRKHSIKLIPWNIAD